MCEFDGLWLKLSAASLNGVGCCRSDSMCVSLRCCLKLNSKMSSDWDKA